MSEVAYSTTFCVVTNHKAPTSLMSSKKWINKITGLGGAPIAVQFQYHLQTRLAETGGVFPGKPNFRRGGCRASPTTLDTINQVEHQLERGRTWKYADTIHTLYSCGGSFRTVRRILDCRNSLNTIMDSQEQTS